MPQIIKDVVFDQTSVLTFDGAQKATGNSKAHFPMKAQFANKPVEFEAGNLGRVNRKQFAWGYKTQTSGFDAAIQDRLNNGDLLMLIEETNPGWYNFACKTYTGIKLKTLPNNVNNSGAGFIGSGDISAIIAYICKFCAI